MAVPTPINLNDSTPAAPAGNELIHWLADNNIPRNVSAYVKSRGGVLVKTASYTATADDSGKLVVFNSPVGVPVTLTLPATAPSANWNIQVQNINLGVLTISPNGRNLDADTRTLSVYENGGCIIATDGTDYYTERGLGQRPVQLVSAWPGLPPAGQIVMIYTAANDLWFPYNLAQPASYGSVGSAGTASAVYTLYDNGVPFATATVAAGGAAAITFAQSNTSGYIASAGHRLVLKAPTTADATLSDVGFTIVALPIH